MRCDVCGKEAPVMCKGSQGATNASYFLQKMGWTLRHRCRKPAIHLCSAECCKLAEKMIEEGVL